MIFTILKWVIGVGITICFGIGIIGFALKIIIKIKNKNVVGKDIKELDKEFHQEALKCNKTWEASKQEEKKRIVGLIEKPYPEGIDNITDYRIWLKKRIEEK